MKKVFAGVVVGCVMVLVGAYLLAPADPAGDPSKPQTPAPPYAYDVEEIEVVSSLDGSVISGTLTLPRGEGPHPAAILLSVAGPTDRNQSFAGHAGFHVLADHLTHHGFAVVRFDDRGVGGSTGDYFGTSWDGLAEDALSVTAFLSADERINAASIGYIGMSQGGAIGALATARRPATGFLILLSAPGLKGEEALRLQLENTIAASSIGEREAAQYRDLFNTFVQIVRSDPEDPETRSAMKAFLGGPGRALIPPYEFMPRETDALVDLLLGPWYRSNVLFDPATVYSAVDVPVLAIGGGKDFVAPAKIHIPEIARVLCQASGKTVSTRVFPDLNHLLQEARTGYPTEYASLTNTFSEQALNAIEKWLAGQATDFPEVDRQACRG